MIIILLSEPCRINTTHCRRKHYKTKYVSAICRAWASPLLCIIKNNEEQEPFMKNKINILCVDGSELIIVHVKIMLREIESIDRFESARTLKHAQEIIQKGETDVVILDIRLPDGNGIDFLKWIKYFHPKICVIMFSMNSDDVHRLISKEYGADYFFDKADEFEKLTQTLSVFNSEKIAG